MATENYPIRNIEVVEVPNIRNREENQQLMWKNEFKQLKSQVEIRRKGWSAFKVPANAYDPAGRKTNREGVPTNNPGVWLACYQYKLFYDAGATNYRASGQRKVVLDDNSHIRRDHFHLNYPYEEYQNSNTSVEGAGLGAFPYERPWDHLYPEPYSIPRLPQENNEGYSAGNTDEGNVVENPRHIDGDRIGFPFVPPDFTDDGFGGGTGGYGAAYDYGAAVWYKTDFSRLIAKNTYYRYENRGYPLEEYATGYRPNDPDFPFAPGVSSVVDGEKYQRVECGYGYFMRPEGWARVANYPWWGTAEAIVSKDIDTNANNAHQRLVLPEEINSAIIATVPKFNSMDVVSADAGQEISLNMGNNIPSQLRAGYLDFYRIVNSNPNENLNSLALDAQTTYVRYNFSYVRIQNAHTPSQKPKWKLDTQQEMWELSNGAVDGDGDSKNNINTLNNALLEIKNLGVKTAKIEVLNSGTEITLTPGQTVQLTAAQLGYTNSETGLPRWSGLALKAEANAGFDYLQRYYTRAEYAFEFKNVEFFKRRKGNGANNFRKRNNYTIREASLVAQPPGMPTQNYTLQSYSSGIKIRSNLSGKQKCTGSHWKRTTTIRYQGILWDGYKHKRHLYSFWQASTISNWTCTNGSVAERFIDW